MTMQAWRIVKAKHAAAAFTGDGAKSYGGRWSSRGTPMVYAAGSASLAILEMLVHLEAQEIMQHYVLFEVSFAESLMATMEPARLPKSWPRSLATPGTVQQVGDQWAASGESAILRLPSVIVPSEWNYLLNPGHADFAKIRIGPKQPVTFDPRLVKRVD